PSQPSGWGSDSLPPVAESDQELVPRLGGDRLLGEAAERADHLAHLLDVELAVRTIVDVALEPAPLAARHRPLEVVGHQLHELPARHLASQSHLCAAGFGSIAPK